MKRFMKQVQALRPDLSTWLFHFANGKDARAKNTIQGILAHGLKNKGKGLCFTESPLRGFAPLFQEFLGHEKPMYAPFGIAIQKDWFFARGGRPVIYLPSSEKKFLEEPISYLYEEFQPGIQDFTWLREWRSKEPVLTFSKDEVFIIVPTEADAEAMRLFEWEVDQESDGDGGYYTSGYRDYEWWYITLDELKKADPVHTSDDVIARLLTSKGRDDE